LVTALASLVLVVHDVPYALTTPFWLDESWVAATTLYPLDALRATTSATPIGFSLLLRLFEPFADQAPRLLPLAFCAATVVAGYALGRNVSREPEGYSRPAAVVVAAAALLSPAMLLRNDLKQYTADAWVTLAVLAWTAGTERNVPPRRLTRFAIALAAAALVSHVTLILWPAAFGAMFLMAVVDRDRSRAVRVAICGIGCGVLLGLNYLLFVRSTNSPGLRRFWQAYYIPTDDGFGGALEFVWNSLRAQREAIGLGPLWIAIPLVIGGLAVLWLHGCRTVVIAFCSLWIEMTLLSVLRLHPFLDQRTSTFLLVATFVVGTIGLIGVVEVCARRGGAYALAWVLPAVLLLGGAGSNLRAHSLPDEDMRTQVQFAKANAQPGDILLVNALGNWAFAYYWRHDGLERRSTHSVLQNYMVDFPNWTNLVITPTRAGRDIEQATAEAVRRATNTGSCRIWWLHIHTRPEEALAYQSAFAKFALKVIDPGKGELRLLDLASQRCSARDDRLGESIEGSSPSGRPLRGT
jgi:hypothetical protein